MNDGPSGWIRVGAMIVLQVITGVRYVMDEWQVQIYSNSLASGAAIYDRTDAVWFPSYL